MVCDICAKGFANKGLFDEHLLKHTKEGAASLKMQCEKCKKWLKNHNSHKRHVSRCIPGTMGQKNDRCDLCGKDVANLGTHKRVNHVERPMLSCSYCGKQFKRAIRHKEHEATHRGREEDLNLDLIKQRLLAEEQRRADRMGETVDDKPAASVGQHQSKRGDKFKGKCHRCGQTNHMKKYCKKKEVHSATSHKDTSFMVNRDKPSKPNGG
nr:zinc finger protein 287-like [Aedes albopictus]